MPGRFVAKRVGAMLLAGALLIGLARCSLEADARVRVLPGGAVLAWIANGFKAEPN